jgi:hypothetical protein
LATKKSLLSIYGRCIFWRPPSRRHSDYSQSSQRKITKNDYA